MKMMAADQLQDLLSLQLEVLQANLTGHILGDDPDRAVHMECLDDHPRCKVVFLNMVKVFKFVKHSSL
jgi:hypothetical protein